MTSPIEVESTFYYLYHWSCTPLRWGMYVVAKRQLFHSLVNCSIKCQSLLSHYMYSKTKASSCQFWNFKVFTLSHFMFQLTHLWLHVTYYFSRKIITSWGWLWNVRTSWKVQDSKTKGSCCQIWGARFF